MTTLVTTLEFDGDATNLSDYQRIPFTRSGTEHEKAPLAAMFLDSVDGAKAFVLEMALVRDDGSALTALARFRSSSVTVQTGRSNTAGTGGRYLYNIAWPTSSNHLFDLAGGGEKGVYWALGVVDADSSTDIKVHVTIEDNR